MIFSKEMICLNLNMKDKNSIIEYLCEKFEEAGRLENGPDNLKSFVNAVHEREKTSSTSLGLECAIPHGRSKAVKEPGVAFARLSKSISWDEDEDVRFIFLVGVPEVGAGNNDHLQILAKLSGAIMEDEFLTEIGKSSTAAEVLAVLEKFTSN